MRSYLSQSSLGCLDSTCGRKLFRVFPCKLNSVCSKYKDDTSPCLQDGPSGARPSGRCGADRSPPGWKDDVGHRDRRSPQRAVALWRSSRRACGIGLPARPWSNSTPGPSACSPHRAWTASSSRAEAGGARIRVCRLGPKGCAAVQAGELVRKQAVPAIHHGLFREVALVGQKSATLHGLNLARVGSELCEPKNFEGTTTPDHSGRRLIR